MLCLGLGAAPLAAQEAPRDDIDEGLSLLERGTGILLRGLQKEMEPALRDLQQEMKPALREFAQGMEPALGALIEMMDDISAYELPEKLPNGDIIIRRKPQAPPVSEIEI